MISCLTRLLYTKGTGGRIQKGEWFTKGSAHPDLWLASNQGGNLQVKRMEMEARSLSPSLSTQCIGKVKDYKADLQKLSQEVKSLGQAAT